MKDAKIESMNWGILGLDELAAELGVAGGQTGGNGLALCGKCGLYYDLVKLMSAHLARMKKALDGCERSHIKEGQ